jgi:glc operon protein GlcG
MLRTDTMHTMFRSALLVALSAALALAATDFPSKKFVSLAAIKKMVAAAEGEAAKRNVQVTICIVDDSGNLQFLERQDGASLNTVNFAQRKARHSAFYGGPSKQAQDSVKSGFTAGLALPNYFPNQGGLPIKADGKTIGGIAVSGAASEVDEAIAQAALDSLNQ